MRQIGLNFEYLDIKTVAQLTGVSVRMLQKRCKNGKYQVRSIDSAGGKAGKKYEILLGSLEAELQQKIRINFIAQDNIARGSVTNYLQNPPVSLDLQQVNTLRSEAAEHIDSLVPCGSPFLQQKVIPESAKKIALAKYDAVLDWKEYRKNADNKKEADKNYVFAFNKGFIAESLSDILGEISIGSLYRWAKALKDNNNSYLALVNNYGYGCESKLNTGLSDIEKQEFIKLYYNDAKLNIATAYHLINIKLSKQGIEIHSMATFRRFADFIRRNHKDFAVLSREGEKALKDKVAPFHKRDLSDVKAGDVLVADGNKLDFMVINPYTGKPARAVWVVFFDWFSFDVAGYEIMLTENTQSISSALRNAIIRLGRIPRKVYMDNGRAFRGKYFKGCKDFNQCGFKGVYGNLGIEEVVAKPYNGRAKIVERFFGDFVRTCPPLVSSYIGNSIANKPAHLNRNEKFHKELHKNDTIPTIEQAKDIIETWLNEFHRIKPCPHDRKRSIGEVFASGTGEGVNIDMLDELMMSECIRTAKRNTIKLFGLEYESADLYGLDDKFIIKYSLFDISKIKVYSLKNEYIGEAKTVVPVKAFAKDGSISDLYNYRMQQKQYSNLIKGTIQKTRSLIANSNPFSDVLADNSKNVVQIEHKKRRKKLEITHYQDSHLYVKEKRQLQI